MLHIGQVVMGVGDMGRAVAFWTRALGYVRREEASGDWAVLEPSDGRGVPLALDVTRTPLQRHPRMHLDLFAANATEQGAEIDRLVALGATRADWDLYPEDPDDRDFVVMADPEGNLFCVIDLSHG